MEIWPTQATFTSGRQVSLAVSSEVAATLEVVVTRLGEQVASSTASVPAGISTVELGVFDDGGYAVTAGDASTAFDVLATPMLRPRYGFLTDFSPGRVDAEDAVLGVLRLHLNIVQFYDWMYRHADLLGTEDEFTDACDSPKSHRTTADLVSRVRAAGALPMAYAATYGVGKEYAARHPEQLLYHADGSPRMLADLLYIADLSGPWTPHIVAQYRGAVDRLGFAGLHLDTYGTPKIAWDATGAAVDLAEQFPPFVRAVRDELPSSTLIVNNVNDYPTFATGTTPQDACYIEVWDPHLEYSHLVGLIQRARSLAPGLPTILAAYLVPFAEAPAAEAAWAARLSLATVFAHGGHYLLCGEGDGVLVHAYYPKFVRVDADSQLVLRRYFDFAVAQGDLLYDPESHEVTRSYLASEENDELAVSADVPVSADPLPGHLWVIVRRGSRGLTVHLIDLGGQSEVEWNRAKSVGGPLDGVRLRVRWPVARALVGSPEAGPALRAATATRDGDYVEVAVPAFTAWATVHLPMEDRT